jgi:hypothetical protein
MAPQWKTLGALTPVAMVVVGMAGTTLKHTPRSALWWPELIKLLFMAALLIDATLKGDKKPFLAAAIVSVLGDMMFSVR